jgi:hypothetical protein
MLKDIYSVDSPLVYDEDSTEMLVEGNGFVEGLTCVLSLGGVVTETASTLVSQHMIKCPINHRNDLF